MTVAKSLLLTGSGLSLVLMSVNCSGNVERSANPAAPTSTAFVRNVETVALNHVDLTGIERIDGIDEIDAAAAAVNLSGTWSGTMKPGGKISAKFTHTGTRFIGSALGLPPGMTATIDLQQKSATATTRTFQGTIRITKETAALR